MWQQDTHPVHARRQLVILHNPKADFGQLELIRCIGGSSELRHVGGPVRRRILSADHIDDLLSSTATLCKLWTI